jgi:hypothetical protein
MLWQTWQQPPQQQVSLGPWTSTCSDRVWTADTKARAPNGL